MSVPTNTCGNCGYTYVLRKAVTSKTKCPKCQHYLKTGKATRKPPTEEEKEKKE